MGKLIKEAFISQIFLANLCAFAPLREISKLRVRIMSAAPYASRQVDPAQMPPVLSWLVAGAFLATEFLVVAAAWVKGCFRGDRRGFRENSARVLGFCPLGSSKHRGLDVPKLLGGCV
jgi:hypothetical protein